jgi:hypothetical protein
MAILKQCWTDDPSAAGTGERMNPPCAREIPDTTAQALPEEEEEYVPVPVYTPPSWLLEEGPDPHRDKAVATLVRAMEQAFRESAVRRSREEMQARELSAAAGELPRLIPRVYMFGSGN